MRQFVVTLLFLCFLPLSGSLFAGDNGEDKLPYIGFAAYDFQVTGVKILEKIATKDGVVKSENRHGNLVEVKLSGANPDAGISILNTSSFSAVINYRGKFRVITARAVGLKPEVQPGKIVDIIISDPEANLHCKNAKAGEKQDIYVYFNIPREITAFMVQVPQALPATATVEK